jgi:hypothetical protein
MRALSTLLICCAMSLVLYAGLFGFVLHKPFTIDIIASFVEAKRAHAEQSRSPKLLIWAGSNALYSHSCKTLEAALSMPCTNLGIARGIAFDYLFSSFKPIIKSGDFVYMPLEYDSYLDSETTRLKGPDAALMVYREKARLLTFGWKRTLYAIFHFDLAFAISSLSEMSLAAVSFRRRAGVDTISPEGDEIGHTIEKAEPYRLYINSYAGTVPNATELAGPSDSKIQITNFLRWAKAHGVFVIGGLPTTFDDFHIGNDAISIIRDMFESEGHRFVLLSNHSQYPRTDFFDTPSHLAEPFQIAHSRTLAEALRPLLNDKAR